MRTHYSCEISASLAGQRVSVAGWVSELRALGGLTFIIIRDREGFVQVTLPKKKVSEQVWKTAAGLAKEFVVAVTGEVKESKEAPRGVEIIPEKIEVLAKAEAPLPVDISGKIESELDTRFDWRSIDLRNPENLAIFKIQSKIVEGFQGFLREKGFAQVFTPCIIGAISEGGSEVFKIKYFEKEAFLRQDPQLHRQLLVAAGLDKIYDLGPSWRAEQSHTTRHMCEHRGCAVEQGFIKDERDTMRLEENMIVHAFEAVQKDCGEELDVMGINLEVPKTPFPELSFPDLYEILSKHGKKLKRGDDYDRESEEILAKHVKEEHGSDFFFVNRFPFAAKPFYVMRVDDDPTWARSVDLIYKGLELSSGGQREHRHDKLVEQVKLKKMNPKNVEWFTEIFRYGVPPHGGFNLGIERITKQMLDLENVREATLFPRDVFRTVP